MACVKSKGTPHQRQRPILGRCTVTAMRQFISSAVLACVLSACGASTSSTPAAYSALGAWTVTVKPDATGVWGQTGIINFTQQGTDGRLTGTYTQPGGFVGQALGNAGTGELVVIVQTNTVNFSGSFSGNTYTGRYRASFNDGSKPTGDAKMTR